MCGCINTFIKVSYNNSMSLSEYQGLSHPKAAIKFTFQDFFS